MTDKKTAPQRPVKAIKAAKRKAKPRVVKPRAKTTPKKSKKEINSAIKEAVKTQPDGDIAKLTSELLKAAETKVAELNGPFVTKQEVKSGSYAESRKFADTDFVKALQCIDSLEDQIADATKRYLKTKRELVLLSKILERAYQDMDSDTSLTSEQVAEFKVAHLSRKLFPAEMN